MIRWLLNLISPERNKSAVRDITGLRWEQAVKVLDAGGRITNTTWADGMWLYKDKYGATRIHSLLPDVYFEVTDWVKFGSGNTWCILPDQP